ncbi:MAG: T9SS type A sorting domain-containing protein, partial [Chitinophagales bacterium]
YKVVTYGNHNGSYDVRPLDSALNRIKLNACFFFPVPGPKMIWQFAELGYDYSIFRCVDGSLSNDCRLDPKPIRWDYFQNAQRSQLYKFYAALINLKRNYTVFNSGTLNWEVGGLYKSMRITDANLKACVLGNFDIVSGNVTPNFPNTGKWYEYFTGDSITVTNTTAPVNLKPGEYRFYTNLKLQQPDLGNVGIADLQHPNELHLQCYPNPAGNEFTLDFYLPEGGNAKLELYDLSGRKIKTISDKNFGSGWFTVDVPADDLENGMYFCKLSSSRMQKIVRVEIEK